MHTESERVSNGMFKKHHSFTFINIYLLVNSNEHCFLKKFILLFIKETLNLSKVTVKTFIMLQKFSISINAVFVC